jgi:hypothetical protein
VCILARRQASGGQDQKATNDKVAMGVGLVIVWPALLFTKGNDENTAELARLWDRTAAFSATSRAGGIKRNGPRGSATNIADTHLEAMCRTFSKDIANRKGNPKPTARIQSIAAPIEGSRLISYRQKHRMNTVAAAMKVSGLITTLAPSICAVFSASSSRIRLATCSSDS